MHKLIMIVTPDSLELPLCVGETLSEVARRFGTSASRLSYNLKQSGKKPIGSPGRANEKYRVRMVEVDEDE